MGKNENTGPRGRGNRNQGKRNTISSDQARQLLQISNSEFTRLGAENQHKVMVADYNVTDQRSKSQMSQEYQQVMESGSILSLNAKQWKDVLQEYETKRAFDKKSEASQKVWDSFSEREKQQLVLEEYDNLIEEEKERLHVIPPGDHLFTHWDKIAENIDRQPVWQIKSQVSQNDIYRFTFDDWASLDDNAQRKTKDIYQPAIPQEIWNKLMTFDASGSERRAESWEEWNNLQKRETRLESLRIAIQSILSRKKLGKENWQKMTNGDPDAMKAEVDKEFDALRRKMKKREWKEMVRETRELAMSRVGKLSKELTGYSQRDKERLLYETYHTARKEEKRNLLEFFLQMIGEQALNNQKKLFDKNRLDRSWRMIYKEFRQQMKKDVVLGKDVSFVSDEDWANFDEWMKRRSVRKYYERLEVSIRYRLSGEYRIRMAMEDLKGLSETERAKMIRVEENQLLYRHWKEMEPGERKKLDKDLKKSIYFERWLELRTFQNNLKIFYEFQKWKEAFESRISKAAVDKVRKDVEKWLSFKVDSYSESSTTYSTSTVSGSGSGGGSGTPKEGGMGSPGSRAQSNFTNNSFMKVIRDKNWSGIARGKERYYNYRMGLSALEKKNYKEAEGCFRKEIEGGTPDQRYQVQGNLVGVDYFPHRELATALYYLGNYSEAAKVMEKSLSYLKTGRGEYYLMKIREAQLGVECITARPPRISYRIDKKDSGTEYIVGKVKSKFYLSSFIINDIPIPVEDSGTKMVFEIPVDDYSDSGAVTINATNLCGMETHVKIPLSKEKNAPPSILAQKTADPKKKLKIMVPYHRSKNKKAPFSSQFIPVFARFLASSGRFAVQIIDPIAEGYSAKSMVKFTKLCNLAQAVEADMVLITVVNASKNSLEIIARFIDAHTHHQTALEEIYRERRQRESFPALAITLTQKILRVFPNVEGHVIESKKGMIAVDLGKNQGVTLGRRFLVYKQGSLKYLGELTISKIFPDISGGRTALVSETVMVEKGDLVIAK